MADHNENYPKHFCQELLVCKPVQDKPVAAETSHSICVSFFCDCRFKPKRDINMLKFYIQIKRHRVLRRSAYEMSRACNRADASEAHPHAHTVTVTLVGCTLGPAREANNSVTVQTQIGTSNPVSCLDILSAAVFDSITILNKMPAIHWR